MSVGCERTQNIRRNIFCFLLYFLIFLQTHTKTHTNTTNALVRRSGFISESDIGQSVDITTDEASQLPALLHTYTSCPLTCNTLRGLPSEPDISRPLSHLRELEGAVGRGFFFSIYISAKGWGWLRAGGLSRLCLVAHWRDSWPV